MHMKKGDKILIIIYPIILIVAVITLFIKPVFFSVWFSIILSLFLFIFAIGLIIYIVKLNKKDNVNMIGISNLIKNKEFLKAEELINTKLEKSNHYVSDIKYKLILVTLELTRGNNDEAIAIIDNNKWRAFEKNLYYYKALLSLKEHNIQNAMMYQDKLIKANNKLKGKYKDFYKEQIVNIDKLIAALNNGVKFDIRSQFPIVKEIMNNIK